MRQWVINQFRLNWEIEFLVHLNSNSKSLPRRQHQPASMTLPIDKLPESNDFSRSRDPAAPPWVLGKYLLRLRRVGRIGNVSYRLGQFRRFGSVHRVFWLRYSDWWEREREEVKWWRASAVEKLRSCVGRYPVDFRVAACSWWRLTGLVFCCPYNQTWVCSFIDRSDTRNSSSSLVNFPKR